MKVGVFGGAFNPIHTGHLAAVSEVADKAGLDRVYFVVSARPPHKEDHNMASAQDRYRMVELATGDNQLFRASRVEIDRPGASYTMDTMRHFRELYGDDVFFIVGQDAMEDVGSWHSASALLKTSNFIVASRPGYDPSTLMEVLSGVLNAVYRNVKLLPLEVDEDGVTSLMRVEGSASTIRITQITALGISSSLIRRKVARGEPVKYLVPDAVERYLKAEGLYRREPEKEDALA
jgi:nicotinate-nucleotide adenylyltransferase